MISYPDAIEYIKSSTTKLCTTKLTLTESIGHRAAETIYSNQQIPSFNNSAMDGFALNTIGLSNNSDRVFEVQSYIQAGCVNNIESYDILKASEITTGSVVPDMYNTVIPVEDVQILEEDNGKPSKIKLNYAIAEDKNIRRKGEDFNKQDVLVEKSSVIKPKHIMAFAALGINQVLVYKKPKISVLSTGTELVDFADGELEYGKIRNSNSPYLQSFLSGIGCNATYHGILEDNIDLFKDQLLTIIESDNTIDAIVTTGSVSMGRYDLIPDAISQIGGTIIFHKTQIRPGKPILFAKLPNNKLFFGLPGNPMSAAIGARFFIAPWIRMAQNSLREQPIKAALVEDIPIDNRFNYFKKAHVIYDGGHVKCRISTGQESFKIKSFIDSNCWVVFPIAEKKQYLTGDLVDIYKSSGFND
ncbi:MAG: molybdopterin molybdotransferase MoeA [Rickettsiaceae bacterium]|nr:molybdopterin molybdotransferase MoeA [Rickettsiaceae bacterium]